VDQPQDDNQSADDFMPSPVPLGEEVVAHAGEPLPAGTSPASQEEVVEALKTVHDPEIPVNIYDLGLIYEHDIKENGDVSIQMSLTAPACPVAGEMPGQVAEAVAKLENTGKVDVTLVWDPPWTPERMSEDARLALGMM
jgi:FeS assembly SUF system protein